MKLLTRPRICATPARVCCCQRGNDSRTRHRRFGVRRRVVLNFVRISWSLDALFAKRGAGPAQRTFGVPAERDLVRCGLPRRLESAAPALAPAQKAAASCSTPRPAARARRDEAFNRAVRSRSGEAHEDGQPRSLATDVPAAGPYFSRDLSPIDLARFCSRSWL